MNPYQRALGAQYSRDGLQEKIAAALRAAGKDLNSLTREDVVALDEFHIRGREATRELARLASLAAGTAVLDIGCGIGGPARTLAAEFGCRVAALDIVAEYCRAAQWLTARLNLGDQISYCCASAVQIPFGDGCFDAAWSQHITMNIEQKELFFAEVRRVLRPRGVYVFYEICAGTGENPHFPVPWANQPAISHLLPVTEFLHRLRVNFTEVSWEDVTAASLQWFRRLLDKSSARSARPPGPGLDLLMGETTAEKLRNQVRNLGEKRITVVQGTAR